MFFCELCEISKNIFYYRKLLVAVSVFLDLSDKILLQILSFKFCFLSIKSLAMSKIWKVSRIFCYLLERLRVKSVSLSKIFWKFFSWSSVFLVEIEDFVRRFLWNVIHALCQKCQNKNFFSGPHSVRIRVNTDQKNSVFRHFSRSVFSIIRN